MESRHAGDIFLLSWMVFCSAPCSQIGVHTVCSTSRDILTVSISKWHDLPRAQFLGLSFQKSVKEKRKKGMPFVFSFSHEVCLLPEPHEQFAVCVFWGSISLWRQALLTHPVWSQFL